jgi:DeoR family transcriptional regulator of aga operon
MKVERFAKILEVVSRDGTSSVETLAKMLATSPSTVRRDLHELEQHRLLTRTRGGAVAQGVTYELPLRYRTARHSDEKRRIGEAVAALVPESAVVGITGGTTTTEAARALAGRSDLTIVTNALNIAAELAIRPNLRIVVTGGVARSASFELVGPIAEQMLAQYNVDLVLLGVDGVDVDGGCSTYDDIEARSNSLLVQRARSCWVLADSSKLGKKAFARICPISAVDRLITDAQADASVLQQLRSAGLDVQLV